MRRSSLVSLVISVALTPVSGFALEKTAVPILDSWEGPDLGGWNTAATCALIYYNRCTLWSLAWYDFGRGDRVGVCADPCCTNASVQQTVIRVFTGAPAGWGFTGTVSITNVDAHCCPTNVLQSQPWLPYGPFDVRNWNVPVNGPFAVVYTYSCLSYEGGAGLQYGSIGTDRPSAGPTGPTACGFCYPSDRPNHSYYWGSNGNCPHGEPSHCPGLTFWDLAPNEPCAPQLRVDIFLSCPVAVEPQDWGSLKNLYR